MTKASGRQTTYYRYKQEHRCASCGMKMPEEYDHVYCLKCLEIKRQENRRRSESARQGSGKAHQDYKLSALDREKAREIYAWLKSLRDSETCRQSVSSGRHVNIQMRALKAAWEAHKREVHQQ